MKTIFYPFAFLLLIFSFHDARAQQKRAANLFFKERDQYQRHPHRFEYPDRKKGERQFSMSKSPAFQQQRPTATQSRLASIGVSSYDGARFVPKDSIHFAWIGTNQDNNLAFRYYLPNNFWYPPEPYFFSAEIDESVAYFISITADTTIIYYWNDSSSSYAIEERFITTLNTNGLVGQQISETYDGANWERYRRLTYTYDGDKLVEMLIDFRDGTLWEKGWETLYTYDANGKLSEELVNTWVDAAGAKPPHQRSTYVYDNGKLVEAIFQAWSSSARSLVNGWKNSFSYDTEGRRTSEIEQSWETSSSSWNPEYRTDYVYNAKNQVTQMTYSRNDGTGLVRNARELLEYDSENRISKLIGQVWGSSKWDYAWKGDFDYPSSNKLHTILWQEWDSGSNSFHNDRLDTFGYNSYDQILLAAHRTWDGSNWVLGIDDVQINFNYEEYDDGISGIKGMSNEPQLSVYPNPADRILNIECKNERIKQVQIFDISGKLAFGSEPLNKNKVSLPICHLSAGLYILEANLGTSKARKTITIQK